MILYAFFMLLIYIIAELKSYVNKWLDVDRVRGPVNISKLIVENLQMPINFPLHTTINTVIILGNSDIQTINDVNMSSFMENVQKVNDIISLENVTFGELFVRVENLIYNIIFISCFTAYGFASNYTHASRSTLNSSYIGLNLHSKRISSTLETSAINVPQTFGYVATNVSLTFVIEGTQICQLHFLQ